MFVVTWTLPKNLVIFVEASVFCFLCPSKTTVLARQDLFSARSQTIPLSPPLPPPLPLSQDTRRIYSLTSPTKPLYTSEKSSKSHRSHQEN